MSTESRSPEPCEAQPKGAAPQVLMHCADTLPENKKPGHEDRAKCLISLVGRDRFELSTYGLRVRACLYFLKLIDIPACTGMLEI
jgi:hypothetical protein